MRMLIVIVIISILSIGYQKNQMRQNEKANASIIVEEIGMMRNEYQNDIDFMIEKYGFTEEDLENFDVSSFVGDYQLRMRNYSKEDIQRIMKKNEDVYYNDGTAWIYTLLDLEEGGKIQDDVNIIRIGYYRNMGSLLEKAVFDLDEKLLYLNEETVTCLTDEQTKLLKNLPSRYNIAHWKNYYEGQEEKSTGSFRWRLVFEAEDGSSYVYGGYTGDMTYIPDNFAEVDEELYGFMKRVE